MGDGTLKNIACIMVQQVTGDYIGHRKFNVTRERLVQESENLEKEGFDVLRPT
jgi:hypothetical protein